MSLLQYSELDWGKNKNTTNYKKKRAVTMKKNNSKSKNYTDKVQKFLNAIQNNKKENFESIEEEDDLANFAPPMPQLTKMEPYVPEGSETDDKVNSEKEQNDKPLELQDFQGLNNDLANNLYYKQHVPYFTQANNTSEISGPQDSLMEKVNYVINMLEEQQDIKNNKTSEELVLYLFLGVFVIFVVDSFARAGKYTR
jgi:hypothetical protein